MAGNVLNGSEEYMFEVWTMVKKKKHVHLYGHFVNFHLLLIYYISLLEVRQTEKDMAVVTQNLFFGNKHTKKSKKRVHVGRNYGCGWTKHSQIILGNLGLSALF